MYGRHLMPRPTPVTPWTPRYVYQNHNHKTTTLAKNAGSHHIRFLRTSHHQSALCALWPGASSGSCDTQAQFICSRFFVADNVLAINAIPTRAGRGSFHLLEPGCAMFHICVGCRL